MELPFTRDCIVPRAPAPDLPLPSILLLVSVHVTLLTKHAARLFSDLSKTLDQRKPKIASTHDRFMTWGPAAGMA